MLGEPILRVAVPSPLRRTFDYLPPAGTDPERLHPGVRVHVPFGRARAVGLVLAVVESAAVAAERLRRVLRILDTEPLLDAETIALLQWTSDYYHHPVGEVFSTALPTALRQERIERTASQRHWQLTAAGREIDAEAVVQRSPRQAQILERLRQAPEGLTREGFADQVGDWRGALRALVGKGWVQTVQRTADWPAAAGGEAALALNDFQREAADAVSSALGGFQAFLLYGVTGSGKTEVYLQVIAQVLAQGRQALVLVPEIGLTPQLLQRFRQRFAVPLVVLHSGLSEQERLQGWLAARDGRARIVIGTRSAVFTPLARPGVLIVDEEHDLSFKQQDGLRYSARDLAVIRARRQAMPVLLASATPSLESLQNSFDGRYRLLELPERAGSAVHPRMALLDVRGRPLHEGLSDALLARVGAHLQDGGQVLLFLNRRGFAPTLLCHDCGWVGSCERCDAHLTLHRASSRLRCHHCGAERSIPPQCPACGSVDLRALGHGTERLEGFLRERFPGTALVRVDRDTTRRKGAMEAQLERARSGEGRILIGTQMLAKGHHFPGVGLVGIVDSDQGLFSADFRAGERMAQLILQVAGRAGRAERPGEVLIQTHHPEHPLLQALLRQDYLALADTLLAERRESEFPPFASLALLRAEAPTRGAPQAFLEQALAGAQRLNAPEVEVFGPIPAPMERRQGRYRAQLLLIARQRRDLHRLLGPWVPSLESLREGRRVRWSLDVDPQDMM